MKMLSGLKSQILALLFSNEGEELYARQIAYKIDRTPRGVLYELEKLEREGILKSRYLGKMRFFKVDKESPTHKDIKNLIIRKYGIPVVVREQIAGTKGIIDAFIYGSVARGTFDISSDIDLFILGTPDYEELNRRVRQAEKKLGREINIHLMEPSEYEKRQKESDPYILDIENNKKIYLIHEGKNI